MTTVNVKAVINNKFSIDVLIMYVYINLQLSLDHVMHIHAHATGQYSGVGTWYIIVVCSSAGALSRVSFYSSLS